MLAAAKRLKRRARRTPAGEERWTAEAIADGILTWHMWPGFQGVHCDECGCEMNVMGMSYGHMCPDCEEEATRKDPEFRHYVMQSMHNHGMMPFDTPRFGPTRATLRRGGQLADGSGYRRGSAQSGTVVALEPSSWPGMRWYRVDIDGGRENQHTYESDMAPLIEDMVSAPPAPMSRANPDCRWCKGTGEVTLATSTRECLGCWPDGVSAAEVPAAVTRVSNGAAIPESEYITGDWEARAKAERDRGLANIFLS